MKGRLVMAAVVVVVGVAGATPSSAWVVKCTKEFREAFDEYGASVHEVRRYANCLV